MSEQIAWSEKYRPKTLDDVQGQQEVVKVLKSSLENGLPNLLFYGPPGSGKTTSILAVAREMFKDKFKERVHELNASNERGIKMIRTTLKDYSMLNVNHYDGIPDYKLVILDESDALTPEAQGALRRMMEDFTKTTRFCLICNYVSKILPPISSRCVKFRFNALSKDVIVNRLTTICKNEGFDVMPEAIGAVATLSDGDLRYAIGLLQKLNQGIARKVTSQDISNVAGVVPAHDIVKMIKSSQKGKVSDIYTDVLGLVYENNYTADSILTQLREIFIEDTCDLKEEQRCLFLQEIARTEVLLIDKTNPLFALTALMTKLYQYYHHI